MTIIKMEFSSRSVSWITFIRYVQSQKIEKPNESNSVQSQKIEKPKEFNSLRDQASQKV